MFTGIGKPMLVTAVLVMALSGCNVDMPADPAAYEKYEVASAGTRQFEWDTDHGAGRIKVLVERKNLGSAGAEMAEIWFPPAWEGLPHSHQLEIIYVIDGQLDHVVNGESHILSPGMTGIVRARDRVVHRTLSPEGVRVLVVWPLGGEVDELAASGMHQTRIGS